MRTSEYREIAMRSKPTNEDEQGLRMLAGLGLIGEVGEIVEKFKKVRFSVRVLDWQAVLKECGDVLWYATLAADVVGMDMDKLIEGSRRLIVGDNTLNTLIVLGRAAAEVAVLLNHPVPQVAPAYELPMQRVFAYLAHILSSGGFSLELAMATNAEKVMRRYPNGYDVIVAATHNSE